MVPESFPKEARVIGAAILTSKVAACKMWVTFKLSDAEVKVNIYQNTLGSRGAGH